MSAVKTQGTRTRSKLVGAILSTLTRTGWTSREALVEKVGGLVSAEKAIKVYDFRIKVEASKATKVRRGRAHQVMLTCITLVQHEKILQRGRGAEKAYRLAPRKAK